MSQLARIETKVGDTHFVIGDVAETALVVGTQRGTIGEDECGRGITAYVAHDVAIALAAAIVFSHDGIFVAIASLDVSMVCQFAHQGSHDNTRLIVVADRRAHGVAVEQLAAARYLARKGSHTVDVIHIRVDRKRAGLDAETLNGADDIIEEA